MVKLVLFLVLGTILGLTFIFNIVNSMGIAFDTIKSWLDSENDFYNLISHLFIITTHPLFLLFLSFGIIFIGIRVMFIH